MGVVEFDGVSKMFTLEHERARSFQELFLHTLRRKDGAAREEYWALRDVSLDIEAGRMVGIIGPNGAGKSTVLKLIAGIIEPTSGQVRVRGRVSPLLELGAGFHPDLTGRENIYLNASILGLDRGQVNRRLADIIGFAELERFADVPVKHYSSGMYVRLGFSVAVHTDPEILLVDEVLTVGDVSFQHKCLNRVAEMRRAGLTIVLVSHDLGVIQSLCEEAVWLEEGTVQRRGHPTDVAMAYLTSIAGDEEAIAFRPAAGVSAERRWGTGRVQIVRVEMCDGHGTARSVFATGTPLEVRLHYWAPERVDDPIFGLSVHHQTGALLTGPNTGFGGLRVPYVEGEGEIVYRVASLPLLDGGYDLSVSVHNRADTQIYDYHDRAYPFRVYAGTSPERYGIVTLTGEWEFRPAGDAAGGEEGDGGGGR